MNSWWKFIYDGNMSSWKMDVFYVASSFLFIFSHPYVHFHWIFPSFLFEKNNIRRHHGSFPQLCIVIPLPSSSSPPPTAIHRFFHLRGYFLILSISSFIFSDHIFKSPFSSLSIQSQQMSSKKIHFVKW